MPGERTPDSSPARDNGSSDDDISLREHLQRQLDVQYRYMDRLHTEQGAYFERVIADLTSKLDERFAGQTKAIDKVEAATEKRFEGVNEFRDQLRDQAATLLRRTEAEVQFHALAQRHDELATRVGSLSSRLDQAQGKSTGIDKAWGIVLAMAGLLIAAVGVLIATR